MGRPRGREAKSLPSINATRPHLPVTRRTGCSQDVLGTGCSQQQVWGSLEQHFDAIKGLPAFSPCPRAIRNIHHVTTAEVCCSQEGKSLSMLCQALQRAIKLFSSFPLSLQKLAEPCQGVREKFASVMAHITQNSESSTLKWKIQHFLPL